MNRNLLRHASLSARSFLLSTSTVTRKPCPSLAPMLPLAASSPFLPGVDSFGPVSFNKLNLTQTQEKIFTANDEDVSDQALKKQIERFYEGDEGAVPSIFEAILKRKLAGKYDEADEKLMEEICGQREKCEDDDEDEFDDDEEFGSDDEEFDSDSDLDESSFESDEDLDESVDEKRTAGRKKARND